MSDITAQTRQPPFDDLSLIEAHERLLRAQYTWDKVGILSDDNNKNTVVVLLNENQVIAALRFNLSALNSAKGIRIFGGTDQITEYGFYQGNKLTKQDLSSLETLNNIWRKINKQIVSLNDSEVYKYFEKLEQESKEKGRGKKISADTKRQVLQFSHGRCMFTGCGEDLGLDEITGVEGNFSYLAHNIASSEGGARGGPQISEKLSNDPSNILLLCDKHHRLIDKIAAADFTAQRLSSMRKSFKETARNLLNGLCYDPIPVFAVLWPVGGNVIAPPTQFQISQALQVIDSRSDNGINVVTENDEIFRGGDSSIWTMMPDVINRAAEKIIMQTQPHQYRGAVFAFGLMPQLIGLGAKLGNKAQFVPMLRSRDTGTWAWPAEEARYSTFLVNRGNSGKGNKSPTNEIAIAVSLTAQPELFKTTASDLGVELIEITISDYFLGNAAISHPEEGKVLLRQLHTLLHELADSGIEKVHLFTCASNCASVFIGMAIDQNHPSVKVYDFSGNTLVARLLIDTTYNGPNILSA